ncbi:unnamed protein product [Cochlearia groenlandica]
MVNKRISLIQYLEWRFILQDLCWCSVDKIACRENPIGPKPLRYVHVEHHGPRHFHQVSVLPFGYPILLWCIWGCGLMEDAMLGYVFFKNSTCVLSTIIGPKSLNLDIIMSPRNRVVRCFISSSNQFNAH